MLLRWLDFRQLLQKDVTNHCTEVGFASFLSGSFFTALVVINWKGNWQKTPLCTILNICMFFGWIWDSAQGSDSEHLFEMEFSEIEQPLQSKKLKILCLFRFWSKLDSIGKFCQSVIKISDMICVINSSLICFVSCAPSKDKNREVTSFCHKSCHLFCDGITELAYKR